MRRQQREVVRCSVRVATARFTGIDISKYEQQQVCEDNKYTKYSEYHLALPFSEVHPYIFDIVLSRRKIYIVRRRITMSFCYASSRA